MLGLPYLLVFLYNMFFLSFISRIYFSSSLCIVYCLSLKLVGIFSFLSLSVRHLSVIFRLLLFFMVLFLIAFGCLFYHCCILISCSFLFCFYIFFVLSFHTIFLLSVIFFSLLVSIIHIYIYNYKGLRLFL